MAVNLLIYFVLSVFVLTPGAHMGLQFEICSTYDYRSAIWCSFRFLHAVALCGGCSYEYK